MKEQKRVSTVLFILCSIITGIAVLCSVAILAAGLYLEYRTIPAEEEAVVVINQLRYLPKEDQIEYVGYKPEEDRIIATDLQNEMTAEATVFRDSYCIADSDSVQLDMQALQSCSYGELYYAYYEIFARHHVIFDDAIVQGFFEGKAWYRGNRSQSEFLEDDSVRLNDYEIYNSNLIYQAFLEYERQD